MYILIGLSGQAARAGRASAARASATMRRIMVSSSEFGVRPRLSSLEAGLALLHEGAAAFDVVLALEALEDEARAEVAVEVVAQLEHLADDPLARLDGERCAAADGRGVLGEQALERLGLGDAVHEPHA